MDGTGLDYHRAIRLAAGDSVPYGWRVLVFTVEEMARSNFYNGTTYVDTMSRAATDAFLESTHELYVQRCGERLGNSIRGIFTDEPHRGPLMTSFGQGVGNSEWLAPWTPGLPERWHTDFGDDIVDHLPELFLHPSGNRIHPTKWRFVETCLALFEENFCRPMDDWCREHGVILTGHFLHEDSLTAQVAMNGSMMRCHATMELPGIDVLTEGNRCWWVAKQLQSVGRQLGKPWRMSELYGCTGWQMTLEDHKNVGDWQALFGINLRCHHLSWFTMEGEAKRDYPASILHQSAWWRDYASVEDYFARLGVVLSHGDPVCRTLVVHPVESVWAQVHPGWCAGLGAAAPEVVALEKSFEETFQALAGAGIDFDYGDEGLMAVHAGCDGAKFTLGDARYDRVVVSGCTTLRSSTVALLREFARAGGEVLFVGERPTHTDALPAPVAGFGTDLGDCAALRSHCLDQAPVRRSGTPGESVFVQARDSSEGRFVVLLNVDRENGSGLVGWQAPGEWQSIERWDPQSGTRAAWPSVRDKNGLSFELELGPGEAAVFLLRRSAWDGLPDAGTSAPSRFVGIDGPFSYELDEPNVLVLDWAEVAVDGESCGTHEVLKADQLVRDRFGLEHRGGEMVQPWFAAKTEGVPPVLCRLELTFSFDVETVPDSPVELALERPECFAIRVNDVDVSVPETTHWWVDTAIRRVPIPAEAIRSGRNTVVLGTDFRRDFELEAVYVLGKFGVFGDRAPMRIGRLPERLSVGDWCGQGLPFYGGAVRLNIPLPDGATQIDLPGVEGACARIDHQTVPWPPFVAPVSGREAVVDIVLTRRNTFGPLHLVPREQVAYGPGHWVTGGAAWDDRYQWIPSGLLEAPRAGF